MRTAEPSGHDWALSASILSFYVLRNANRRREAAENALRRANEDLEKRVAERTNKLAEQNAALGVHTKELGEHECRSGAVCLCRLSRSAGTATLRSSISSAGGSLKARHEKH
jgi:C4-dicarboxylate-specific signal transduction histidine kinase